MEDQSLATALKTSPSSGPIKSGSLLHPYPTPAKAGYISSPPWISALCRVIGWAMHQIFDACLVLAALRMALLQRRPRGALILHSDRGAQFVQGSLPGGSSPSTAWSLP